MDPVILVYCIFGAMGLVLYLIAMQSIKNSKKK